MQALVDLIVDALTKFIRGLFGPVEQLIEDYSGQILKAIVDTPTPDRVFGPPTNGPWPEIYEYYWEVLIPLTLSLYGLSIGLIIFLESTSYLFTSYHRAKLKKRAFSGLLGILSWWWIAALSLQFMNALAGFLVPDLSNISLFQTASFSVIGVLGVAISLTVDLVLFILIGLMYFMRRVMLYLFVLLMPLLIVLWIPGVGPFTLVSRLMKRLAGFFPPFLFMTIPVALLFRLGELLGQNLGLEVSGIAAWLTALVIPFVAVASPLLLFWQAGAIFMAGERVSHHTSASRARKRIASTQQKGQSAIHESKNFARGVQGKPAVQQNGQTVLGSGGSRAHAKGSQLNNAQQSIRNQLSQTLHSTDTNTSSSPTPENTTDTESRQTDFSNLRDRGSDASTDPIDPHDSDDTDRPASIY